MVDQMRLGVAIVTYNGPKRVAALLESLESERPYIDELVIQEDPVDYPEVHPTYGRLALQYRCTLHTGEVWGCMQGNATCAMNNTRSDIMCLLSDDVIVTRGCIKAVREFWERYSHFPIGAAGIARWDSWDDLRRMGLIHHHEEFYPQWQSWISKVPYNDFWINGWIPRLYVNVHGSGFSLRRDVWKAVGGFSPETWCYDEDIAAKIWLYTPCVVAAVPGPPMVHFGGASQCGTEHPETRFHTIEAWYEAWGSSKELMHAAIRKRMAERAYVDDLFKLTSIPMNAESRRDALQRCADGQW